MPSHSSLRQGLPVAAMLATSLAMISACTSKGADHAGTSPAGSGPRPSTAPKAPGPFSPTVPTISNSTRTVMIDHAPVTFPSTVTEAAWSPTGARLAYVDADGNIATALPDGSGVLVLTPTRAGVRRAHPTWEDGGCEIVFTERGTDGVWHLMSVAADGHAVDTDGVTPVEEVAEDVTPSSHEQVPSAIRDATRMTPLGALNLLAYQNQGARGPEVFILDRNQRGVQPTKVANGSQPAISPDGGRLAFVGANGQLFVEILPVTPRSRPVQLTFDRASITHAVWSPDSKRLAFATATDVESIAVNGAANGTSITVESRTPGVPTYQPPARSALVRYTAADAIVESIAVSRARYTPAAPDGAIGPGGTLDVMLAVATDPDAGLALISREGGPLLLTGPNTVDTRVAAEIKRLVARSTSIYPKTVYLFGGRDVVSPALESSVRALGYRVVRELPSDADRQGYARWSPDADHIVVVSASEPAAVASVAPFADSHIVLLTDGTKVPTALQTILDVTGVAHPIYAVGAQAQAALAGTWSGKQTLRVIPLGGASAADTSVRVIRQFSDGALAAGIATTAKWADVLVAASEGRPLLLVDPAHGLDQSQVRWLSGSAGAIGTIHGYGDQDALPEAYMQAALNAISGPAGVTRATNPSSVA